MKASNFQAGGGITRQAATGGPHHRRAKGNDGALEQPWEDHGESGGNLSERDSPLPGVSRDGRTFSTEICVWGEGNKIRSRTTVYYRHEFVVRGTAMVVSFLLGYVANRVIEPEHARNIMAFFLLFLALLVTGYGKWIGYVLEMLVCTARAHWLGRPRTSKDTMRKSPFNCFATGSHTSRLWPVP